jgi:hypothetical protein
MGNIKDRTESLALKRIFSTDGMCLICGELDPRFMILHHVFGKAANNFTISLCANCHRKYINNLGDLHYVYILSAIEKSCRLWGGKDGCNKKTVR